MPEDSHCVAEQGHRMGWGHQRYRGPPAGSGQIAAKPRRKRGMAMTLLEAIEGILLLATAASILFNGGEMAKQGRSPANRQYEAFAGSRNAGSGLGARGNRLRAPPAR